MGTQKRCHLDLLALTLHPDLGDLEADFAVDSVAEVEEEEASAVTIHLDLVEVSGTTVDAVMDSADNHRRMHHLVPEAAVMGVASAALAVVVVVADLIKIANPVVQREATGNR